MSLALARKWRPKLFNEIIGQDHVVKALTNALKNDRLHHAWLLSGTRGVGKTTLARILAKAINCKKKKDGEPCSKCDSCNSIDNGSYIDVLEFDAASNTQVDSMREILETANYAPNIGDYKVYIIDEVHMLSKSAFNAMLKTLEEPPLHVKFILATTEPKKIPSTVLSRCLQLNLKRIPSQHLQEQLDKILVSEEIEFDLNSINLLAKEADGSLRDALSLLEQAIAYGEEKITEAVVNEMLGGVSKTHLVELFHALAEKNGKKLMSIADSMAETNQPFDVALTELASILHSMAIKKSIPEYEGMVDIAGNSVSELTKLFSAEEIQLMYQISLHGKRDFHMAPDGFSGFTMTLLRILAFSPERQLPEKMLAKNQAKSSKVVTTENVKKKVANEQSKIPNFKNDWRKIIEGFRIGGMARMLSDNCEVTFHDFDRLELSVSENQIHLIKDKMYLQKLREELEKNIGTKLKIKVSLGGNGKTIANEKHQEKELAQEKASESIENDPFVKGIVQDLGGKVIQESIKSTK